MAKQVVNMISHKIEVLDELENKMRLALKAVGMDAAGFAQDNCPVDTGLLRNSITFAVSGESPNSPMATNGKKTVYNTGVAPEGSSTGMSVYIGTELEYAIYRELKSFRHTTGKAHFLRDSISQHGKTYKKRVKEILDS